MAVHKPHTLLASVIGAGVGFLIATAAIKGYEVQRLEDCGDFDDYTICSPPPSSGTKNNIRLGSTLVFIPIAIYTDRARFAWQTVYRKRDRILS